MADFKRLGHFVQVAELGPLTRAADRLRIFAWCDTEQIAARLNDHFAAGADHVCLQGTTGAGLPPSHFPVIQDSRS